MNWKAYSWKAITCCVSKGVLTLLAGVAVLAAGITLLVYINRWTDRVDPVVTCFEHSDGTTSCTEPPKPAPTWWGKAIGVASIALLCFGLFAASTAAVGAICSSTITYCQVAVDTKRRPWYFLPWIGDPLPKREVRATTCEACGNVEFEPESENEYRARLGLAPLERA
jgi:hypothetical protein